MGRNIILADRIKAHLFVLVYIPDRILNLSNFSAKEVVSRILRRTEPVETSPWRSCTPLRTLCELTNFSGFSSSAFIAIRWYRNSVRLFRTFFMTRSIPPIKREKAPGSKTPSFSSLKFRVISYRWAWENHQPSSASEIWDTLSSRNCSSIHRRKSESWVILSSIAPSRRMSQRTGKSTRELLKK